MGRHPIPKVLTAGVTLARLIGFSFAMVLSRSLSLRKHTAEKFSLCRRKAKAAC
jgi:hypothetical protein